MHSRFSLYSGFVLLFNIAVVLWGAFVRATGSGAGCGEHWPLCNGEVLPRGRMLETIIEFTHRATSGIALLLVIGLIVWAFRAYPIGSRVRQTAFWSIALTLSEGLIGAMLVLLGHVAANQSVYRGVSLSLHLVNTLALLAALALTWWHSLPLPPVERPAVSRTALLVQFTAAALLLTGVSGAIAALGDTLFAAKSLAEGIQQDFSPAAHLFLRLRLLHPPVAALGGALCLLVLAGTLLTAPGTGNVERTLARCVTALTFLQATVGVMNLLFLAPVWLQILHLLIADALWISFVLLADRLYLSAPHTDSPEMSQFAKA